MFTEPPLCVGPGPGTGGAVASGSSVGGGTQPEGTCGTVWFLLPWGLSRAGGADEHCSPWGRAWADFLEGSWDLVDECVSR